MLVCTGACQLEDKDKDKDKDKEDSSDFYIDSLSRHQSPHKETSPMFDCEDKAVCDLVSENRGLERHHIEGRQSRSFIVDGRRFHFAHFEFGIARDCPAGCFFSHYCVVVVDNTEFPVSFHFNSSEESLFNSPDLRSEVGGSQWRDMPAFALPLFRDETFIKWVGEPKNKLDEFRYCRTMLAWGYSQGKLPKPASSDSP